MAPRVSVADQARLRSDLEESRCYFQDLNEAAAVASVANPYSRAATPTATPTATAAVTPAPSGSDAVRGSRGVARSSRSTSSRGSMFSTGASVSSSASRSTPAGQGGVMASTEPLEPERETIRANRLRADQDRPNVHVALHYIDQAMEYGLPSNCNVLMGEDQHRSVLSHSTSDHTHTTCTDCSDFKALIYTTNFINPERDLLQRVNLQMTIRFILGGSFIADAALTEQVRRLHTAMPGLFRKLLPRSEQLTVEDKDEALTGVQPSPRHLQPSVLAKLQAEYCKATLNLPTRGSAMSPAFRAGVSAAYTKDYGLIVGSGAMGTRPIRWFKKVSFTDPYANPTHSALFVQ